jgi:hypothetical protein
MASLEQGQMRQWALRGAEARLLEISNEAEAIHRTFPELRGRRNGASSTETNGAAPPSQGRGRPRGRRTMSADARRRISEAQKARWAKQKGEALVDAASKAAPPAKAAKRGRRRRGARKMSAAARKRISDAQKARWAKQRESKRNR